MLKLTDKQIDELWDEEGPYSEARIIIEHRILDDSLTRVLVTVEANVNPTTFEIIRQNRRQFAKDPMITQLIDHAEYLGPHYGWVVTAYCNEYTDKSVIKEAEKHLEYTQATLIKMHKFALDLLDIKPLVKE